MIFFPIKVSLNVELISQACSNGVKGRGRGGAPPPTFSRKIFLKFTYIENWILKDSPYPSPFLGGACKKKYGEFNKINKEIKVCVYLVLRNPSNSAYSLKPWNGTRGHSV